VKRRYLITGAQGLVGRYLTAHILDTERDSEVVGIGRSASLDGFFTHAISTPGGQRRAPLPAQLLASLSGRHRYRSMSLLDTPALRELLREVRPHCVFHLASALHTASERELLEANVEGTASLMKAVAGELGSEALVIVGSSGSVYGEAASLPVRESDPCNPAEMYGLTKLAAEQVVRIHAARSGFGFVTARIFNVVGPGQSESHVCARLAAQLASLASSRPAALEVGPLDTTRDFIDVRDVAAALLLLAQRGERGGTYNLASGRSRRDRTQGRPARRCRASLRGRVATPAAWIRPGILDQREPARPLSLPSGALVRGAQPSPRDSSWPTSAIRASSASMTARTRLVRWMAA
jgi:GDP-4-dehydro-6-deoxy-D-mannose reductase